MNQTDLKQKYSKEHFLALNSQLIDANYSTKTLAISTANSKLIETAEYLGEYQSLDLHIITIKHTSSNDARVGVSMEIFKLMKDYAIPNALVAAYSAESDSWRYSLITTSLSINSAGKITKAFSSPRRYSFVLGPNQKVLTPFKQLVQLGKVADLTGLSKRFALEVVNNEFYKEIASLYDELVGTDKLPRKLKYPTNGDDSHEFAVRLIGRIIFCWFLREKKSKAGVPLIPTSILSCQAAAHKGYYHAVLAPLFFEVLNKPINQNKRSKKYETGDYKLIPYLNGGLFNDDDIDKYEYDSELELTISSPTYADVPDDWFHDFFDLLERYNFTVDENTSYDTDLAIDPEMLGRVFENLLARINPETGATVRNSTGSFYTPREIVEYMVDSSLTEYLITKTNVSKAKLDALISYDIFDDIGNELSIEENVSVLEALSTLTVLDPACGSGAYPIGVLQKIVFIITRLDPEAKWWLQKQLAGASPELKKEFENRSIDYVRKLGIIRQTIFGVDIQPIATEISRLRCFLTLIVDEEIDDSRDDRGIRPLPNLDFKFVTANTLIGLSQKNDDQIQLVDRAEDIDELATIMAEYFTANTAERDGIKYKFTLAQKKIFEKLRVMGELAENTHTLKLTNWDPFENIPAAWFDPKWMFGIEQGFDIVIGNPPYIQLQNNGGELADMYKNEGYATYARSGDIYSLFYERGLHLTKHNSGLLCYITSNKWMRAGYGKSLRRFFINHDPLILLDLGSNVFESATVDTNIILIRNSTNTGSTRAITVKNNKAPLHTQLLDGENIHFNDDNGWSIGTKKERELKSKIEKIGKPLKDWDIKINYGIKTGLNEAFIIDKNKRGELIAQDPKSEEIIKPILRGRDIKKYWYESSELYIIFIPWHFPLNNDSNITGASKDAEIEFEKQYPVIFNHVVKFKDKLLSRNKEEVGKRYEWFALQRCANTYYKEFGQEKVVWGNISYNSQFCFVDKDIFINAPANMITSNTVSIKYLIACMNSSIFNHEFKQGGIFLGKAFEWKKQYVENVHLPIITSSNQPLVTKIEKIVDQILTLKKQNKDADTKNLESQIDQLVYKLYDLTPDEIAIIEGSTK